MNNKKVRQKKKYNIYNFCKKNFEFNNKFKVLKEYIKINNLWERCFLLFAIRFLLAIIYIYILLNFADFKLNMGDNEYFAVFLIFIILNAIINKCERAIRSTQNKKAPSLQKIDVSACKDLIVKLNFKINISNSSDSIFNTYVLPISITYFFELKEFIKLNSINDFNSLFFGIIILIYAIHLCRNVYTTYKSLSNPYSSLYLDSFSNIILDNCNN